MSNTTDLACELTNAISQAAHGLSDASYTLYCLGGRVETGRIADLLWEASTQAYDLAYDLQGEQIETDELEAVAYAAKLADSVSKTADALKLIAWVAGRLSDRRADAAMLVEPLAQVAERASVFAWTLQRLFRELQTTE